MKKNHSNIDEMLEKANLAAQNGQWERCTDYFNTIAVVDSIYNVCSPADLQLYASALFIRQQFDRAESIYINLLQSKNSKQYLSVLNEYAILLIETLRFDKARNLLMQGLLQHRNTNLSTTERGLILSTLLFVEYIYGNEQETNELIQELRRDLSKIRKHDVKGLICARLAQVYLLSGNFEQGAPLLDSALALHEKKNASILQYQLRQITLQSSCKLDSLRSGKTKVPRSVAKLYLTYKIEPQKTWSKIYATDLFLDHTSVSDTMTGLQLCKNILESSTVLPDYYSASILQKYLTILETQQKFTEILNLPTDLMTLIDSSLAPLQGLAIHSIVANAYIQTGDFVLGIDYSKRALEEYHKFIANYRKAMRNLHQANLHEEDRRAFLTHYMRQFDISHMRTMRLSQNWATLSSKLLQRLQLDSQDREVFAATFVHDLGNILHGLKFYSEENPISEENAKLIRSLSNKATNYLIFVRNFIEISAIPDDEMVPLSRLIRDVKEDQDLFALTAGVELIVDETDGFIAGVHADILKETVLANIVHNAIKFTPTGKKVRIGSTKLGENGVKIYVADEGPGISKETQDRVHAGFAIRSQPGARNERGNGIGLKLVRRLVERMNGKFIFDAPLTPEGGTQISLIWE